ncbi:hypothetical protein C8J57DRAFT_1527646 [Mycena rebaudengoi]|nr:hypothetical protein C8J57DRAFT_1527646 [Mycena rebaudengoi]
MLQKPFHPHKLLHPKENLFQISQPFLLNQDKYIQAPGNSAPLMMATLTNYTPMWWVKELSTDKYRLEYFGAPGILAAAMPRVSQKVYGSDDPALMSTWAIDRAGDDLWTIKVRNTDLV